MTELIRLDPTQRDRATEVLVQAFRGDPIDAYICPDDVERVRSMRGLWDAVIGFTRVYGEAWTTPEVNGVACWLSPGHAEVNFRRMLRTGLALPRALMRFDRGARRRTMDVTHRMDRAHERVMPGPHWYLWALGVMPAAQGQGIGSRLMQPVLARADAVGVPCYLETGTERNVAFYRKRGFEVATAEDVSGNGLMMWTMIRKPQR